MSNRHDHMSKPAPRTSPEMNLPGRPSVIAHDGQKSVHTDGSPFRKDGENIHQPPAHDPRAKDGDDEDDGGVSSIDPGSSEADGGGSFFNPPFKPSAGTQAALYYERKSNRAGRPALK